MSGSGDFISRADAIEALYKDAEAHPDHTFWTTQHEALLNIPAADVRPVARGGWEEHGEPNERGKYELWYYSCTRCGAVGVPEFNYCPNCGADMRGES